MVTRSKIPGRSSSPRTVHCSIKCDFLLHKLPDLFIRSYEILQPGGSICCCIFIDLFHDTVRPPQAGNDCDLKPKKYVAGELVVSKFAGGCVLYMTVHTYRQVNHFTILMFDHPHILWPLRSCLARAHQAHLGLCEDQGHDKFYCAGIEL